jgi:hypothetical protein
MLSCERDLHPGDAGDAGDTGYSSQVFLPSVAAISRRLQTVGQGAPREQRCFMKAACLAQQPRRGLTSPAFRNEFARRPLRGTTCHDSQTSTADTALWTRISATSWSCDSSGPTCAEAKRRWSRSLCPAVPSLIQLDWRKIAGRRLCGLSRGAPGATMGEGGGAMAGCINCAGGEQVPVAVWEQVSDGQLGEQRKFARRRVTGTEAARDGRGVFWDCRTLRAGGAAASAEGCQYL